MPCRNGYPVSKVIHYGQRHVAGEQIARALDLLHAFSHDVIRNPLLEVGRLGRDLGFSLPQLEDEADVVEEQHPVGELDFLLGAARKGEGERKLAGGERKRSREYVRVMLGDEILQETGRFPVALFHRRLAQNRLARRSQASSSAAPTRPVMTQKR